MTTRKAEEDEDCCFGCFDLYHYPQQQQQQDPHHHLY